LLTLAEKERKLIAQRTKDALAAAKAKGVKLGGMTAGSIKHRDEARARAEALRPIFAKLDGKSDRETARILTERKIATPTGASWSPVTVKRVRRRLLG
jgi:DNA invertase Pin-like site-specific DNA recombinase